MSKSRRVNPWPAAVGSVVLGAAILLRAEPSASPPATLAQQNRVMLEQMQRERGLTDAQMQKIRAIFAGSGFAGQGNPRISVHPDTPGDCLRRLEQRQIQYANPQFEQICGAKYMAPLFDPKKARPEQAKVCIDQFEYPDVPCTFPVVWVKARETAELCEAEDKRICDAHEWEGACAGELQDPDYRFDLAQGVPDAVAVERMRAAHNQAYEPTKSWSYGPSYQRGICAAGSNKTPGCPGGGWNLCGSNTYPTGDFPDCHSDLGVYDLNGNAAEQMNLPLNSSQMASRGSTELGVTEMKGSWFIFDRDRAHPDWCRWRAPFWHGSRVMDPNSHANYHLGFRCCKGLPTQP
jgi:hypothetical protein